MCFTAEEKPGEGRNPAQLPLFESDKRFFFQRDLRHMSQIIQISASIWLSCVLGGVYPAAAE